ncbi:MAG: phospholipase [Alphaproteobacteria bacterium]|nr:phospholipase [Alphaproteobacteria bacterium]PHX98958.1 MAG: phospholipase [Rhodospirillaceae bacterium]
MSAPSGPSLQALSQKPATSAAIFLHGYGSNGDDLIGLAPAFAQNLPSTAFYSPQGPEPWEGGMFGGRQWFTLAGYDPEAMRRDPLRMGGVYEKMFQGAVKSSGFLHEFIDDVARHHNLSAAKIALIGFSQGTMMALHTGLRRAEALAGIVGFSGAMVGGTKLKDQIKSRPPVVLIHGSADPVVPVEALSEIKKTLDENAVPVEILVIPGHQHGIDQIGAERAITFLRHKLSAA